MRILAAMLIAMATACTHIQSTQGGPMPAPGGWDTYCATHDVPECSKP
jgi:hypothetical protein